MIRNGDICWVDLRRPTGSEPGHRCPVVIVSDDRFNRSMIGTVVAVALTSNLRLGYAPGNVLLPAETSGLGRDSVANISQIVTLNKGDLSPPAARADEATMGLIRRGLALVLSMAMET